MLCRRLSPNCGYTSCCLSVKYMLCRRLSPDCGYTSCCLSVKYMLCRRLSPNQSKAVTGYCQHYEALRQAFMKRWVVASSGGSACGSNQSKAVTGYCQHYEVLGRCVKRWVRRWVKSV